MGGVVNAVVDAWHCILRTTGHALAKMDKHDIYKQIQIQQLYPNSQHLYRKKLISYKHQLKSNYEVIKKLVLEKSKYISIPRLNSMGLLAKPDSDISTLNRSKIELYISKILKDSDVKISYKTNRTYRYDFYIYQSDIGNNEYSVKTNLYTTGPSGITPNCPYRNIFNQCSDREGNRGYWKQSNSFTDYSDKNRTYETGDNIDWKIMTWLEDSYKHKNENIQYIYKKYFNKANLKITFKEYNIKDDDYYKPIITNNSVETRSDSDNGIIEIHMVNVDNSDDDIWVEWNQDKSVLLFVYYTSINYPKGNVSVLYYDKVVDYEFNAHFLCIPVKKDGDMINDDSNALRIWLHDVGLSLPENIDNGDVKDVLYCAMGKYKDDTAPTLTNYNQYIYGDLSNKHNVRVNTGVSIFDYGWEIQYEQNANASVFRTLSVNGFNYAKIYAGVVGDQSSIYNNTDNKSQTGVNHNETTTEEGPMYLIPLEAFETMPLNEFFDAYFKVLQSVAYAEKEVTTKWYATELFQFLIVVILIIAGFMGCGLPCFEAAASIVVTKILVEEFGMDPTVATIVVAIVTLGANLAAQGTQIATQEAASQIASETVSTTGADLTSAAAINMSAMDVDAIQGMAENQVASMSVYDEISIGLKAQLAAPMTVSGSLEVANFATNIGFSIEQKHQQKRINQMKADNNNLRTKAKEITDKLEDIFKNSITLLPVKFDILYDTMYSDPMNNQVGLDHKYEYEAFAPLSSPYV